MSCVLLFVRSVFICVNFVFDLVKGMITSGLLDLLFISSISCCVGGGVGVCLGVCL